MGTAGGEGSTPGRSRPRSPDRVTIYLDAKPATVEGDPIQVFGPAGHRIDRSDARTDAAERELSVGLREGPAGSHAVVYRIVSRDAHLIAGQLAFTSTAPAPAETLPSVRAPSPAPSGLRQAAPATPWPRLALVLAAGHLASSVVARRRLRHLAAGAPHGPARARGDRRARPT